MNQADNARTCPKHANIGSTGGPRYTDGQAMVEFATVSLIFFALLFGVIEGGRMLFTYHQVINASREGARYALARGDAGDTQISGGNYSAMTEQIISRTTGLSADNIVVEATWPGDPNAANNQCPSGSNNPTCPVQVTVTYTFEPIVAFIFGAGSFDMTSSSEMLLHY